MVAREEISKEGKDGRVDKWEKESALAPEPTGKHNEVTCRESWLHSITLPQLGGNQTGERGITMAIRARLMGTTLRVEVDHHFHQTNNTEAAEDDSHVDHRWTTCADIDLQQYWNGTGALRIVLPTKGLDAALQLSVAKMPVPCLPMQEDMPVEPAQAMPNAMSQHPHIQASAPPQVQYSQVPPQPLQPVQTVPQTFQQQLPTSAFHQQLPNPLTVQKPTAVPPPAQQQIPPQVSQLPQQQFVPHQQLVPMQTHYYPAAIQHFQHQVPTQQYPQQYTQQYTQQQQPQCPQEQQQQQQQHAAAQHGQAQNGMAQHGQAQSGQAQKIMRSREVSESPLFVTPRPSAASPQGPSRSPVGHNSIYTYCGSASPTPGPSTLPHAKKRTSREDSGRE